MNLPPLNCVGKQTPMTNAMLLRLENQCVKDLLKRVAWEMRGNPSIVLSDGQSYKPIPTERADKIEELVR